MSFLGVLAGALSAEAVLKQRSLFASMVGQQVGSELFTLVDDGTITIGPAASPFDDEGVPTGRTELFTRGTLNGFLHNTYTAARTGGGTRSTGNAKRGGYKSTPGVGTSNFYLDAGELSFDELLATRRGRRADPGRERRAFRREPHQRRVLRRARRACGSPAARWASRCAR